MTAAPTVAVWTSSRWPEADGLEFLRIVVALVACGDAVRLVEAGAGLGVLASDEAPDEAEHYLGGLRSSGVEVEAVDDATLRDVLTTCRAVVHLGEPDRSVEEPVLVITNDTPVTSTVANAGQVLRDGVNDR